MTSQQRFQEASSQVSEALTPRDLAIVAKLLKQIARAGAYGRLHEHYVRRDYLGAVIYHAIPGERQKWYRQYYDGYERRLDHDRLRRAEAIVAESKRAA